LDAFISLVISCTLFRLYDNLSLYPPKNLADRLFIHYGFTIFTAWSLFSVILNFWFAVSFLNTTVVSVLTIIILGIVGFSFTGHHKRHDVVFAATISWILVGISVEHQDTLPILVASLTSIGFILGGILKVWIRNTIAWFRLRRERENTGERSSLLA
jgi:hypothetical protein